MSDKKLMNVSQFAKHMGVKPNSIRLAIKNGILRQSVTLNKAGSPMIDPEIAVREYVPREPNQSAIAELPAFSTQPGDKRLKTDWSSVGSSEVPFLADSKARREAAEAELAELKLEKERGKLVDAEETKQAAFKVARITRDAMLNIPDRVANELAAETDSFKIHQRLTAEIRKALESLSAE